MSLLKANKLSRVFGTNVLFQGLDFAVNSGDFVAISGKSGIGKSTLLHLLSGLDSPTAGEIIYQNYQLEKLDRIQLARLRNQHFGLIFQQPYMLADLNVIENCMLPARYNQELSPQVLRQRAKDLLEFCDIAELSQRLPAALSGGELQRLGVARALLNDPHIVFADEPTVSLDSENANKVMQLLAAQHSQGRTIVLVSHDQEIIQWADYEIKFTELGDTNARS